MIIRSRPTGWILLFIEIAPLVAFSYSGRLGLDITHRFYLGAGLAIFAMAFLATRTWSFNPLIVSANVWLCLEAFALGTGIANLVHISALLQEAAFFATMLCVGAVYVACSENGLFSRGGANRRRVRQGSLLLLSLIAASLVWSLVWRGNELIAAVIPATAIFLLQQVFPVDRRAP